MGIKIGKMVVSANVIPMNMSGYRNYWFLCQFNGFSEFQSDAWHD
jgi:hypothetical protein